MNRLTRLQSRWERRCGRSAPSQTHLYKCRRFREHKDGRAHAVTICDKYSLQLSLLALRSPAEIRRKYSVFNEVDVNSLKFPAKFLGQNANLKILGRIREFPCSPQAIPCLIPCSENWRWVSGLGTGPRIHGLPSDLSRFRRPQSKEIFVDSRIGCAKKLRQSVSADNYSDIHFIFKYLPTIYSLGAAFAPDEVSQFTS